MDGLHFAGIDESSGFYLDIAYEFRSLGVNLENQGNDSVLGHDMTSFDDVLARHMSLSFSVDHDSIQFQFLISDQNNIVIHFDDGSIFHRHDDIFFWDTHIQSKLFVCISM
jgi:hypothetical protein